MRYIRFRAAMESAKVEGVNAQYLSRQVNLVKFLFSIVYSALLVPLYLTWGRSQVERQIDKMQEAAFNTPGAEAPVTSTVLTTGLALVGGHFLWGRLIGLRVVHSLASLIIGTAVGLAAFLWRSDQGAR